MALFRTLRLPGAAVMVLSGLACLPAAAADYTFEADYRVSLAGFELGEAVVDGTFDGLDYRIDGRGKLTGLAGALVEYRGSASAAGHLDPHGTSPSAFSVDATDGENTTKVRMALVNDDVRRIELEPPLPKKEHPARVTVQPRHKMGVIDPMSALMVVGTLSDGHINRSVCNRTFPVFNGRERFDIDLSFKERRQIKAPGYTGMAVVCQARYKPIAGHRSDRDEVKYFAAQTAEVIYIPVHGANIAIPFKVTLPTPLGQGEIAIVDLKTEGALRTRAASLSAR